MAFTDNFTDTDGVNLEDHTPSGGTSWTLQNGTAGDFEIQGNELAPDITIGSCAYVCDDQGSADHYSEAVVVAFGNNFRASFVCIRLVDEDNWIGWKIHGTGSAGLRMVTRIAATIDDTHVQTQGDGIGTVTRIDGNGSTVKLYEDGGEVGSVTITDHQTETSQGVTAQLTQQVNNWVDDFEAASLAGVAALIEPPLLHSFAVTRAANY